MPTQNFKKSAANPFGAFKDFKMPNIDFAAAMSYHRENMERFAKAQKVAVESAQNMTKAHAQYMKEAMKDLHDHMQEATKAKSLEETMEIHGRRVKSGLEKAVAHSRSMTQTYKTANKETQKAFKDCLEKGTRAAKEAARKAQDAMKSKRAHKEFLMQAI